MRISDWSSDVCSSDLHRGQETPALDPADDRRCRNAGVLQMDIGGPGAGLPHLAILLRNDDTGRAGGHEKRSDKIGRASWRDRVCQYESISVVAVSLKIKKIKLDDRCLTM